MKLCVNCVLPENFPSVRLDQEGVCNYCRAYPGSRRGMEDRDRYRMKFIDLIRQKRGSGDYDVVVAYSGGKDSTYTLDLLKNGYGLKTLALTFDNGFVSRYAFANIGRVVEALGVDHLIFKPDFTMLRKVFASCARSNPYSFKSLERASSICTACMNFVKAAILKIALDKRIPFIGYGWSPGQAPIRSSVMKMSPSFARAVQQSARESLRDIVGTQADGYFLRDSEFERTDLFPYSIHPLAFETYDEEGVYRRIRQLGWVPPEDTDPNSTNCVMNAFAVYVHKQLYHFHPYAFEVSGLVRAGVMARSEGIRRLDMPDDERTIAEVSRRLFAET